MLTQVDPRGGPSITVAYAGVHQAYEMAAALQQRNALKEFYCAVHDAPGRWGRRAGSFIGRPYMEGRRADGLEAARVVEFPWPLIYKAARDRIYPRGVNDWRSANGAFDRWVARRIAKDPPAMFVGVSTSALHSLRSAKAAGAKTVLHCPSVHPDAEAGLMRGIPENAGIGRRIGRALGRKPRQNIKLREYAESDVFLVCSEFQKQTFCENGIGADRVAVVHPWIDPALWYPEPDTSAAPADPLKVLFVGALSARKGLSFLLQAMDRCGAAARLTVVGPGDPRPFAAGPERDNVAFLPAQPKPVLRRTYNAHDLLVLPSLSEAFGRVAAEAMACGLPVIASTNCGVPLPDPDWSVPPRDPEAIAARILHYEDRARLEEDGRTALAFAKQFALSQYRERIGALLTGMVP